MESKEQKRVNKKSKELAGAKERKVISEELKGKYQNGEG